MDKLNPTFWVRDVPVYGDVILAPMAGFADVPHRAICRAYGSAMNYTEFVAAAELLAGRDYAWQLLDFTLPEQPMVFQIFGSDADQILEAARQIEALGPDIIDINMGCSTRRVSSRGAGVAMMRDPALVARTFSLLSRHLSVPVTGKIRLGWEDCRNYLEIGRIMEDNGAALVAIHPRTKEQRYGGRADWQAITELKDALSIPVVGNGDIETAADIDRMLTQTGCDAVMIGRAAIGNPWIFARRARHTVTYDDVAAAVCRHVRQMVAYYGNPLGLVLFRKHLKRYLQGFDIPRPRLRRMLETEELEELESLLLSG